ncbi:hypothetical protein G9A89_019226 [Geosiphon pyriformis]|nr:hypothetical protein G9A89_019226 [Geosiphon pyriformis]
MLGYLLSTIIWNFVGLLYPAYASYKAIKTNNISKTIPWLMYWIVLSLFIIAEGITDKFIFWFPFYYELKMIFIIWLILPKTQGAIVLYNSVVDPTFADHEEEIDSALWIAQERAKATSLEWAKKGFLAIQGTAVHNLLKGHNAQNESVGSQIDSTEKPGRPSSYIDPHTMAHSSGTSGYWEQGRAIPSKLLSLFYPPNLSPTQKPVASNEPSSPTIYLAHPVGSVLPDDIFDAPISEQQAYLQEQKRQVELMMNNLEQVQQEIQERSKWNSETLSSTPPPTPGRSSPPDSNAGSTRKRPKKSNSNRRSPVYYEVEEDEQDFERVEREAAEDISGNGTLDDQELRRRQTQAIGLTSYLTGYFSRASN